MSRTVFILGAGASKRAGAPLIADFLDRARELARSARGGRVAVDVHAFDLVEEGRQELLAAQAKFGLEFNDLESVFAAFEMAGIIRNLGTMDVERVGKLPGAMRRLIVTTLEETTVFPVGQGRTLAPEPYGLFVKLIRDIHPNNRPWERSAVITLNYDMALDYALHSSGIPMDYCLSGEAPAGAFRAMKLHGSLGWGWCPKCKELSRLSFGKYFEALERSGPAQGPEQRLRVGSYIAKDKHSCGEPLEPFIVPPTWNKTVHAAHLGPVWAAAARELAEAEEVIVIGYSLPETDLFFRYLLALGTAGKTLVDKLWVFNPDLAVGEKFRALVGPASKGRFRYEEATFEEAIGYLRGKLEPTPGVW